MMVAMTSPAQVRVGQLVRSGRVALELSQEAFARKAGVDPGTVSSLETGKRWPRAAKRAKIARALGWDPDDLDVRERLAAAAPSAPQADEGADAAVIVLSAALSAFERAIMDSGLSAEKKLEIITAHRSVGGDELIEGYRRKLMSRRRSGG